MNKLDEILENVFREGVVWAVTQYKKDRKTTIQEAKQAITDLFEEKCLRCSDINVYLIEGIDEMSIETFKTIMEKFSKEFKERARKEFEC